MKTSYQAEPRHRCWLIAAALMFTGWAWLTLGEAQDRRERNAPRDRGVDELRQPHANHDAEREDDTPRSKRNPDLRGTPEGMSQPRLTPPRGEPHDPIDRDRWILGVHAYNTPTGVVITQVAPRSAAMEAGLEDQDVIITVNGFQVGEIDGRLFALGDELQHRAGLRGEVRLLVQNWRNRELVNLDVRLRREQPYFNAPRSPD